MGVAARSAGSVFAVLAVVVAVCLALTACGPGPGEAAPSGASTSAQPVSSPATPDPRPTPASSTGAARNLPRPELPEIAKQNTKEGFAAFTQYWLDTVTYGLETGDSGPLKEISLPDCKMCNGYIERAETAKSKGEWNVGPKWWISEFTSNMRPDADGRALAFFALDESRSTLYSSDGSVAKSIEASTGGAPKAVLAKFEVGRWLMSQSGKA
ncbi:DUF6318 family protein [Sinomonas albida]|uniref:DUF6318 family protein n=1 Tax=Sinomonas albida TaxID=369942 RepID=UPI0010A8976C|nr:DUF6318 family protein [Sinomonas albida]